GEGLGKCSMTSADLVSVATFRSPADAQTAKNRLDVAGIESVTRRDPAVPDSHHNAPGAFPKNAVTQERHPRLTEQQEQHQLGHDDLLAVRPTCDRFQCP